MRSSALALVGSACLLALCGCIPSNTGPMMDQAGASCFVDRDLDAVVLMLPVVVGSDSALEELELLEPDGLDLTGYTVVASDDVPYATSSPLSDADVDALQTGPADPPLPLEPGTSYWLVAVAETDGGGSAAGFRLTWRDEGEPLDARLAIEVGSVCSM